MLSQIFGAKEASLVVERTWQLGIFGRHMVATIPCGILITEQCHAVPMKEKKIMKEINETFRPLCGHGWCSTAHALPVQDEEYITNTVPTLDNSVPVRDSYTINDDDSKGISTYLSCRHSTLPLTVCSPMHYCQFPWLGTVFNWHKRVLATAANLAQGLSITCQPRPCK